MTRRPTGLFCFLCVLILFVCSPPPLICQHRLESVPAHRLDSARLAEAVFLLRHSIAEANTQALGVMLAAGYAESGVASNREEAIALISDLRARAEMRDVFGSSVAGVSGEHARWLGGPLHDFDLIRPQISFIEGSTTAIVICEAAFYGLRPDSSRTGAPGRRMENVELEFRKIGQRWKLQSSEGLMRFLSDAIKLMEQEERERGSDHAQSN